MTGVPNFPSPGSTLLRTCAEIVTRMQNPTSVFASFLTLVRVGERNTSVKHISLILAAALLAGCSSTHQKGISQVDEFDAVKVDQMVGNNISSAPFQKVIICINARRETHQISALT